MKEQVIVFEGEHMFVAPKKRISNKKKGVQVAIPEDTNVVGVDKSGLTPIQDPPVPDAPREPDEPIRIVTNPPSGSSDISVRTFGGGGGGGTITTQPTTQPSTNMGTVPPRIGEPIVGLGNPTKQFPTAGEELVAPEPPLPPAPPPPAEPAPAPSAPSNVFGAVPLVPLSFGSAPRMGGGGGGGGAEEEAPVEKKKTNYLWLVLLGIAGLIYFTKKKS